MPRPAPWRTGATWWSSRPIRALPTTAGVRTARRSTPTAITGSRCSKAAACCKLSPTGELLREVQLPLRCPTAVAFGGSDLRTLYVTSASHGRSAEEIAQYPLTGKVLCMRVDVAGVVQPEYKR